MFRIVHQVNLDKKFTCASCGGKQDLYKIEFTDENNISIFCLCEDCMYQLGNEIYEKYMENSII